MHRLRAGVCLLGLGMLVRPPSSGPPADVLRVECDSLPVRVSDPLHYRQRGDRCEGLYGQNVAGSSELQLVSLVEHIERFDDTASAPVRVEWTPPQGAAVTLRASPLRAGLYYRMETARPIAGTRYDWPSDVRRPLRIGSADIGLLGWTTMTLGGKRHEVYVPLRVTQRGSSPATSRYRLTLWPSVGLSEVYVTVAATGADGAPARYLQRDEKLGYGFYPATRPIEVRLPALSTPGVYFVRVSATRESGGGATRTFLLHHPGGGRERAR
jgi:hypothetical protein